MKLRSISAFGVCLGASAAAAAAGAAKSRDAGPVYARLTKPRWAPPASVFGPVWTILYTTVGIAAWRAGRSGAVRVPLAWSLYATALTAAVSDP
jgi:translocator protein